VTKELTMMETTTTLATGGDDDGNGNGNGATGDTSMAAARRATMMATAR
jgi:hypothetical protein